MSKRNDSDVEVRPDSQGLPTEKDLTTEGSKPTKASSNKNSDRIMIFNKED